MPPNALDLPGKNARAAIVSGDVTAFSVAVRPLVEMAERRPPDEPSFDSSAATLLLALTDEALATPMADTKDPEVTLRRLRANALRWLGPARDGDAVNAFTELLAMAPSDGHAWFDFGLLHKYRGRFRELLAATDKAQALLGPEKRILWNAAIGATALGEGELATHAWRAMGLPAVMGQHLPRIEGIPPARLRVPSVGDGVGDDANLALRAHFELPWIMPESPCHGVVVSPTFGRAAVDYGDVVLWDGAPVSVVEENGRPVPRFPLLEILRRGDEQRFRFLLLGDAAKLEAAMPSGAAVFFEVAEVQTVNVRSGEGDAVDVRALTPSTAARRGKLVLEAAVPLAAVARSLETLRGDGKSMQIAIPSLYEALGDARRAGQEHQAWRGIEKYAARASA